MAEPSTPGSPDQASDQDPPHPAAPLGRISFDDLNPTEFEEFAFDLVQTVGYVNVDWRKGTPKDASPSDSGRDIEAYLKRDDVDGHVHLEKWFIDCKKYAVGVPAAELNNLISWGFAERARVGLVIASGYMSNGAKDMIAQHNASHGHMFRLRAWEYPQLHKMIAENRALLDRHQIIVRPHRTRMEVADAHTELLDREFYDEIRSVGMSTDAEEYARLAPTAQMRIEEIEERFQNDPEKLDPWTSEDRHYYRGARDALGWVLGQEWKRLKGEGMARKDGESDGEV